MARQKGSANLAATLEILAGGALDARTVVPTEADLILASNFPYPYIGLPVVVQATGEMWVLMDMDVTDIEHWHKIGSGGADNVVEGYYNETDGKFYEESTYTTEITGAENTIYIALDTNYLYYFDGTDFISTTVKSDTRVLTQAQFNALPQSEKDNGTTYYISDAGAMQGVCVMGNRFDKANIYTEDERMVGSYIGKPLYQKTFSATISSEYPLVSGVFMRGDYSLLDANLDIEDMVFADGFYTDATSGDTSSFIDVWYNTTDSKLYFITYLERENATAEFTIRYTKNSDGTVAVGTQNDYNTDEQIVGTWIDGKKLYQKTLVDTTPLSGTSKSIDISALNVDYAQIVNALVYGEYPSGTFKYTPISQGSSELTVDRIDISSNTIELIYNASQAQYRGNHGYIITIQYTKTTE